jgi:hypothetical protein
MRDLPPPDFFRPAVAAAGRMQHTMKDFDELYVWQPLESFFHFSLD